MSPSIPSFPALLLPFVTLLLLVASSSAGAATRGEAVSLETGETAEIDELQITFVGIDSDNRCPVDVQCIVAGAARVRLRIDADGHGAAEIRVDVPPKASGRHRHGEDELEVKVAPEPTSGSQIAAHAYVVTLVVEPVAAGNQGR